MTARDDEVRIVEEAYRTWNEQGPRAFVEYAAEDVEVHDPPELPDAQAWHGREAAVGRFEDVVAATGSPSIEIGDVRAAADEVLVTLTVRSDAESAVTLACVYHLVRVENRQIARIRVFLEEDAALRTAAS